MINVLIVLTIMILGFSFFVYKMRKKTEVRHTRERPFLIKIWMSNFGYVGLATYWNTIYYATDTFMVDQKIRKHELCHIGQMKRDGVFKHFFMYNYYWFKYGHKNNPYEVEAREAELL